MQKGFALKEILLLIAVIAAFSAVAFPRYFWEKEKSRALAMDVILDNATLAEDAFYRVRGYFPVDWVELAPYFSVPPVLDVDVRAMEGTPAELYFAFIGPNRKPEADGYILRLEAPDGEDGEVLVSARRIGGRYDYSLQRKLGKTLTQCVPLDENSQEFCSRFSRYLAQHSWTVGTPEPETELDKLQEEEALPAPLSGHPKPLPPQTAEKAVKNVFQPAVSGPEAVSVIKENRQSVLQSPAKNAPAAVAEDSAPEQAEAGLVSAPQNSAEQTQINNAVSGESPITEEASEGEPQTPAPEPAEITPPPSAGGENPSAGAVNKF